MSHAYHSIILSFYPLVEAPTHAFYTLPVRLLLYRARGARVHLCSNRMSSALVCVERCVPARQTTTQEEHPTCIGGRDHPFPRMLGVSSTSAVNTASDPPIMRLIRHTMERCSGSYLALPNPTCIWHRAVFGGTGTWRWWRPWGTVVGLVGVSAVRPPWWSGWGDEERW